MIEEGVVGVGIKEESMVFWSEGSIGPKNERVNKRDMRLQLISCHQTYRL